MVNQTKLNISVVIVGGGVGGLALAMFLAQDGHQVVVLERSDGSYGTRSTGGIALFHNSMSIMKRRNLFDLAVKPVADTGSARSAYRYTGEFIGKAPKKLPHSFVHRGDLLLMFSKNASELGVDIRFNTTIKSISETAENVTLTLADGTGLKCDIVVGADGLNSFVRAQIFPDVRPRLTPSTVMLLYIPKTDMEANTETNELYADDPYQVAFGPERNIVSWAMTNRQVYHLQMCDYNYRDGEAYGMKHRSEDPLIEMITDTSGLKRRWSDYGPRWQHIIDSATEYYNWRIAEMPPMQSYTSSTGRIWLMGDACHAVQPFAGQGANMAFEDAESLAILLASLPSARELPKAAQVYYQVRSSRLAGLRKIINSNIKEFGLPDGEEQRKRDASLQGSELSEESNVSQSQIDAIDQMSREERFAWLEEYDVAVETLKVWSSL